MKPSVTLAPSRQLLDPAPGCRVFGDLLPIWNGANCAATQERVGQLIEQKQAEIAERIAELTTFAEQLDVVRAGLEDAEAPAACRDDLSCCVPESGTGPVAVELMPVSAPHR